MAVVTSPVKKYLTVAVYESGGIQILTLPAEAGFKSSLDVRSTGLVYDGHDVDEATAALKATITEVTGK